MIMRNCGGVKDTGISAEQKAMVDIIIGAKQDFDRQKDQKRMNRTVSESESVACKR